METVKISNSDSQTDAFTDSYLPGFTNHVFSTLAEASEECKKLPQSQGFISQEWILSEFFCDFCPFAEICPFVKSEVSHSKVIA